MIRGNALSLGAFYAPLAGEGKVSGFLAVLDNLQARPDNERMRVKRKEKEDLQRLGKLSPMPRMGKLQPMRELPKSGRKRKS